MQLVQRRLILAAGHACQAISYLARGFEQAQQALVDAIEPVTLLLMSSDGAVVIQVGHGPRQPPMNCCPPPTILVASERSVPCAGLPYAFMPVCGPAGSPAEGVWDWGHPGAGAAPAQGRQ